MRNTNTGGPAFPTENARQTGPSSWHEEGMTLRDYFAAKAMQAFIQVAPGDTVEGITAAAFVVADAMLKAREE